MDPATYTHVREVGVGMVAMLLIVLTFSLGRYIYTHRVTLTVADREARSAAVGLGIFFGALSFRASETWVTIVASRMGWETPQLLQNSSVYITVLTVLLIGAFLTIRAFHDWPLWLMMILACVSVPIGISFI